MQRRLPLPPKRLASLLLTLAAAATTSTSTTTSASAAVSPQAPIVQPGAPGEPSRVIAAGAASDLSGVAYTKADVEFMQGMISHHAQALEMTALLPSRTASEDMKKLAHRIELSQADEIKMMQGWLRSHGQEVTDVHAHHMHGAMLMPGMLTPEQMDRLTQAKGVAFDRLFLELMIQHHQGALDMVKDLLAHPGAAQTSEIFAFTSDITADQTMEIERMRAMRAMLKEPPR